MKKILLNKNLLLPLTSGVEIFLLKVLQPGGAAIVFPKSGRNEIPTPL